MDPIFSELSPEQQAPAFHPLGSAALVIAGAGSGKCLAKGTPVLLFDGRVVLVEDVKVGDLLMGPDSGPRRVQALGRGQDQMYRIHPTKGDPWGCNSAHILVLVPSGVAEQRRYGAECEMSVTAYLASPRRFKKIAKLYRVGVSFPEITVPLDPYFIGLFLGDGCKSLKTVVISKPDVEVCDYLYQFTASHGLELKNDESRTGFCPQWRLSSGSSLGKPRAGRNLVQDHLRGLGLEGTKFIPRIYKVNSERIRLQVLAGLIDSDGYIGCGCVQIVTKYAALSDDILYLCRSLGFAAYMTPVTKTCTNTGVVGDYFSLSISGDLSRIPMLIPRKQGSIRLQIKNVLRTGFKVIPEGSGAYYGFELDGDGQFLLGDFTVTHNTRLMTARVKWVIAQGLPERSVVAVTFTNKAADELRSRLGYGEDPKVGPRVSTIHSLSLSAIRKNPRGFGLFDRVTPLDSYEQRDLLKKLADGHKYKGFNVWDFVEHLEYHRARGVGFVEDYTSEVHRQAKLAYKGYHALDAESLVLWEDYTLAKQKASLVDFSDMLHLVVRRGREDDAWRAGLQKQFTTVMVDESQDLSPLQWSFIELLLAPDNRNLFSVGDLSQSIFGFTGASPNTLSGMVQEWRGEKPTLYKLEDNYRSLRSIVKFSNNIQSTMTGTVPLTMQTKRTTPKPGSVTKMRGPTSFEIAHQIAMDIAREHRSESGVFKYKDNAILVRTKKQFDDIEPALAREQIPYVVHGGLSLFQTEEARDMFAYLKLVINPSDTVAFKRAIGVPKRGIGDVAIGKLQEVALAKHQGDLIHAAAQSGHMSLQPFGRFILELQEIKDPAIILQKVINFSNYNDYILEKYRLLEGVAETKLDHLNSLLLAIQGLSESDPLATTADIIFRVTLDHRVEAEKESGVVTLSTIHSCIHPATLVETPEGLVPIKDLADHGMVNTPTGMQAYTAKFINPEGPAFKVTTKSGYEITITPEHGMTTWDGAHLVRVKAQDLQVGDWLRLKLGSPGVTGGYQMAPPPSSYDIRTKVYPLPVEITEDVAEFLGFMVADGSLFAAGFRAMKSDADVVDRFAALIETMFHYTPTRTLAHEGRAFQAEVCSHYLADWLRGIGGMDPCNKFVPEVILRSPLTVQAAFLRGLFEDGTVNVRDGSVDHIAWSNKTLCVVQTVQTMLLHQGIVSSVIVRASQKFHPHLYIFGPGCSVYRSKIGFISRVKNENLAKPCAGAKHHSVPVTRDDIKGILHGMTVPVKQNAYLRGYVSKQVIHEAIAKTGVTPEFMERVEGWHYERITAIEPVRCPSMCLEVPEGSRFLQNGFDGWNSKGQEWPRVYVTNLFEGSLPHQLCVTPSEIEEERRLFYVAVTRGMDVVSLCIPVTARHGRGFCSVRPSRFLFELGVV